MEVDLIDSVNKVEDAETEDGAMSVATSTELLCGHLHLSVTSQIHCEPWDDSSIFSLDSGLMGGTTETDDTETEDGTSSMVSSSAEMLSNHLLLAVPNIEPSISECRIDPHEICFDRRQRHSSIEGPGATLVERLKLLRSNGFSKSVSHDIRRAAAANASRQRLGDSIAGGSGRSGRRAHSLNEALREAVHSLYRMDDFNYVTYHARGFFSDVYKAHHTSSGRVMALKMLNCDTNRRSVYREFEIMNKMYHPHILKYVLARNLLT